MEKIYLLYLSNTVLKQSLLHPFKSIESACSYVDSLIREWTEEKQDFRVEVLNDTTWTVNQDHFVRTILFKTIDLVYGFEDIDNFHYYIEEHEIKE